MDVTDLLSWIGKPPPIPNHPQNTGQSEETQDSDEASSEQSSAEQVEIISSDSSAAEEIVVDLGERDELALDDEDELAHTVPSSNLSRSFFIDIPEIPNKDDYEHLAGHSVVDRVLSEYPGNKYLVKLGSGEVELASVPLLRPSPITTCLPLFT